MNISFSFKFMMNACLVVGGGFLLSLSGSLDLEIAILLCLLLVFL